MNFTTLQGLTIPEGVVTQITDASGRVLWAVQSGDKVILEVEKITSNTYAGETTYTDEQFILLDIYPKTNGTVRVTYGGLTKTITDTSGAAEPNAQQVFFGTFNGVSDSVETPASGELTIEGEYRGVAASVSFNTANKSYDYYVGVTAIKSFGNSEFIPASAFASSKVTNVVISSSVKEIQVGAFNGCSLLSSARIPASVEAMISSFYNINKTCFVEIDSGNTSYKIDGNGIVEIATNTLVEGFLDTVIPSYITTIGSSAFVGLIDLTNIIIPASVNYIAQMAFQNCTRLVNMTLLATTPPKLSSTNAFIGTTCTFTVPKGCGEAYKTATNWGEYADRIVEAS